MRRCIVLCVSLALTACSPKSFSGEQAVRTYSVAERADSTSMKSWLEKAVRECMEKNVRTSVDYESVTVRETLSAPDSCGRQHVTSVTTTRSKGSSVSSSGTSSSREEVISEGKDSTAVSSGHEMAITEEHRKFSGEVSGWMPWYVYVVSLVGAVLFGFWMFVIRKKRI